MARIILATLWFLLFVPQGSFGDDDGAYFLSAYPRTSEANRPFMQVMQFFGTNRNVSFLHGEPGMGLSGDVLARISPPPGNSSAPFNLLLSCNSASAASSNPSMIEQFAGHTGKPTTGFRSIIIVGPAVDPGVMYLRLVSQSHQAPPGHVAFSLEGNHSKILNPFVEFDPTTQTSRFGGNPYDFLGLDPDRTTRVQIEHARGLTEYGRDGRAITYLNDKRGQVQVVPRSSKTFGPQVFAGAPVPAMIGAAVLPPKQRVQVQELTQSCSSFQEATQVLNPLCAAKLAFKSSLRLAPPEVAEKFDYLMGIPGCVMDEMFVKPMSNFVHGQGDLSPNESTGGYNYQDDRWWMDRGADGIPRG